MYRTSKYSKETNAMLKIHVLDVLSEADRSLTNDEIRARDIALTNVSAQKISRILSDLSDMGMVHKLKRNNKMTYLTEELANKLIN